MVHTRFDSRMAPVGGVVASNSEAIVLCLDPALTSAQRTAVARDLLDPKDFQAWLSSAHGSAQSPTSA